MQYPKRNMGLKGMKATPKLKLKSPQQPNKLFNSGDIDNVIFQHPVAMFRSGFWCTLAVYAQLSLSILLLLLIIGHTYAHYMFQPNWPSSNA
jgi:hypothetical protein